MKTKQKVPDQSIQESRRDFMKKSSLAGAGLAAAAVAPGAAVASIGDPAPQEKRQQQGYQLTPHVIEYYKSAAS